MKTPGFTIMAIALAACLAGAAQAQISDDVVKIGVLGDQAGLAADIGGKGAVLAARMAAEDAGGRVRGKPVEIVDADFQLKPDIAAAVAQRWYDSEKVDAVADLPLSSAGLAVQEIAKQRGKTVLIAGAATSELTGKACSPVGTHWADDTWSLSVGTARALVESGQDTWFFLTADYALGHAIERDGTATIERAGGKVLGSVRHPLGAPDFASYLLQAQQSKARIVGLASVGGDTINAIKQASEFGIAKGGQTLAGILVFITDIHSLGLATAQKLFVSTGFYWDQNDGARDFAKRFFQSHGRMPTKQQASTYASVRHFLKAVEESGTDDGAQVNAAMRRMPVDYFGRPATIRADGRVMYDLTLYQVKAPEESRYAWDYYKPVRRLTAKDAFRPADAGGCSLSK